VVGRGRVPIRIASDRVSSTDPPPSYRAIEGLIATYAELVDDGDFAAVGVLLADATFTGAAGSVTGRQAIEKMLRENVIVYDDGTPRTKHVTSNVAIPGHWVKPIRPHGLVAGPNEEIPAKRGHPRRGSTKKHGGRVTLRPTSMPVTLR